MRRLFVALTFACAMGAVASVLGGCGQTGPLYLPSSKAQPAAAPVPATAPQTTPTPSAVSR